MTLFDGNLGTEAKHKKPPQCVICGQRFASEDFLLVHQAEVHAEHAAALGFNVRFNEPHQSEEPPVKKQKQSMESPSNVSLDNVLNSMIDVVKQLPQHTSRNKRLDSRTH